MIFSNLQSHGYGGKGHTHVEFPIYAKKHAFNGVFAIALFLKMAGIDSTPDEAQNLLQLVI